LNSRSQDDAPAHREHREQDRRQSGDVARRDREQGAVGLAQPHARAVVEARVDQVEVRQHRALRPPGRAGGVQDDRGVFLVRIGPGRDGRVRIHQRAEVDGARRVAADREPHRRRGRLGGRWDAVGEDGIERDRLRAALVQDERDFRPLLPDVDRHRDHADAHGGEQQVNELALVGEQQHDPVAARDTEPAEVARQPTMRSSFP
jgi:hypothetical protein